MPIFDLPEPRYVLGLGSGTSADGCDLALLELAGRGQARQVRVCHAATRSMSPGLRTRIHAALTASSAELAALHFELGREFGRMAADFLREADFEASRLSAIGSHGQTVYHHDGEPQGGSLQLGDLAVLAAEVGAAVIGDFRWNDLAAGGQGAPISPFADWILHGGESNSIGILNLGGIANLTLLRGERPPLAWDCGPANGPLDALVCELWGQAFDRDGKRAAEGRVVPSLLANLQKDSFFQRRLPRSTGLERFGAGLVRQVRHAMPETPGEDLLATFCSLAGWAVASSLSRADWEGGAIYLCGGGGHNPALVAAIEAALCAAGLPQTRLESYALLGWDPDFREAVAFGLLADAFLCGETSTWPSTTGCRRPSVLGRWVPAPEGPALS